MRRKILWITFGMTMAFWLGCAGKDGEQNYKELENGPREPVSPPERSIGGPNPAGPRSDATPTGDQRYQETTAAEPVRAGIPATDATRRVEVRVADRPATQPAAASMSDTTMASSDVLDRSGWPRVTVTPAATGLRTHPVYFSDGITGVNTRTLDTTADTDAQLTAVLGGSTAATLHPSNLGESILLPAEFGRDLVLLPIRAIQTFPWELQPARGTSPSTAVGASPVETGSDGASSADGESAAPAGGR